MPRQAEEPIAVTILSPDSTRAELVEALQLMCHEAKREQHIVGTLAYPTRWDRLHSMIDDILTLLVGR